MAARTRTERAVERRPERRGGALERRLDARGHPDLALRLLDGLDGLAQRRSRRQVERHRHRRELPGVVDDERSIAMLDAGDVGERNLLAIGGGDEHLAERLRTDLEARRHFEHDAILVGLGVDRRDQPLAERIVERIVDGRDPDAEAAGGVAIDVEEGLEAAVLQIAGDVGQVGRLLQPLDQLRHPLAETARVRILQRELELGAAHAVLDREVLHRLHVDRRSRARGRARSRSAAMISVAVRDRSSRGASVTSMRPLFKRGVGAVDADERGQALRRRAPRGWPGPRRAAARPWPRTTPTAAPR